MSGLFGSAPAAIEQPRLAAIQLQVSQYGGPVTIVYGTTRIPGNVLWYSDFKAVPHTTKQGGKGGASGGVTSTEYTYTAAVVLGLCEGPIAAINRVWRDKDVGSLSKYGFSWFVGNRTQTPWSYLTSYHPAEAIGYAGTAIVCASVADLGPSGTLKNHSFEVTGFLSVGGGNLDAHPADVISDLLTNPFYGASWPSARLGDLTTFRTYCTAQGFWLSPAITEQRPASQHIQELLDATNSDPIWSEGVLKIVPYGDTPITANGATYTPNVTPLYDLNEDDFLVASGSDPVSIERVAAADAWNCVPVEFLDRSQDYNTSVVEDPDPVDVEAFGLRKAPAVSLHCITRAAVAQQISRIRAQRSVYVRNKYKFKLGWRYILLEPMDLVTLTDPKLGLDHKVVRIRSVEEDESGALSFVAEEWPFGVAHATAFTTQTGDGAAPNVDADPGNANAPVIFDAPLIATDGQAEVWIGTASANTLWGGCEIWVSADGTTYTWVGRITNPARHGTLTSALPIVADPDNTSSFNVDLTSSLGALATVSAAEKDDLETLAWISDATDGELISFQTATLISANRYTLSGLRRGAYGTGASAHAIGAKFVRCDDALFRYRIPDSRIGSGFYVKLQSFNVWGGGVQDLSTVPSYFYTPSFVAMAPPIPASLTLSITTSAPAVAGNQWRAKNEEAQGGSNADTDGVVKFAKPRWANCVWTYTPPVPAGLHVGFRVVLYDAAATSDPNDTRYYLRTPIVVPAATRSAVIRIAAPVTTTNVGAAVQALYVFDDESSWRTAAGTVVVDPDTTTLKGTLIGGYVLDEPTNRALNTIDQNPATDRFWYCGTDDGSVRGGAPNIACCTVTRRRWDTTYKFTHLQLSLTPTSNTDNLDALRYAKVELLRQSAAGTSGTLTSLTTVYVKLPDRLYFDKTTDNAAGNAAIVSAMVNDAGINGGVPAAKVTIFNCYGPSDTHCFYSAAGAADDVALVDNGTSWPAGLSGSSGGGSGGGGGRGGNCPAPWVPILMADGAEREAGAVRVGDLIRTEGEDHRWGSYRVLQAAEAINDRAWVFLEDGRELLVAVNHEFYVAGRGWTKAEDLRRGWILHGSRVGVVNAVLLDGPGPVVKITVEGAQTYVTDGIWSHNMPIKQV